MRLIACILAVLVLFLSGLPCADTDTGQERQLMPFATQDTPPAPAHDHTHDLDLCSPFCVCSCCATFSVVVVPFVLAEPQVQLSVSCYAVPPGRATIAMPFPVWQPPQLV